MRTVSEESLFVSLSVELSVREAIVACMMIGCDGHDDDGDD